MSAAGPRGLIVEDDRVWQQILGEILGDAGLAIDVAPNLDAAIPLLRGAVHRLAVVDLALSGGDHHNEEGLRVLDTLHQYNPACLKILLTGYATVELAVSVLTEHGAFTCLRKETFNRRQFRRIVERALAGPAADSSKSAVPAGTGDLAALTERERQVLELLAKGMTNKEIAEVLVITPNTVKQHLKGIFQKLGTHTRSATVAKAIRAGVPAARA